jgi:two-component system chemotaxis sensor kinase CheA
MGRAVAALAATGVDVRELSSVLSDNGRQVRALRASIMRLRMVPVRTLLERVPLLVRGLSRETGRPVRLDMNAGEAELDKAVADRVFPAIVHIIRNAVDHGIEAEDVRQRAGKDAEGLLRLRCAETSNGQLEIVIEDDGQGLDGEAVARRANQPLPRDDAGLLDLITRPGLSTAAKVTTTSGRGLGMDIVKRIVTGDLGGELSLQTTRGKGTTFTLRIPLTITIVDAFSFVSGGERFVTPVGSIEEILEVDAQRVIEAPHPRAGTPARLLRRRGEALPLFALSALFGLPAHDPPAALAPKALVVRRHAQHFAFEVERMLGQQEVVVRPLDDPLVRVTGVSGSTDLGDGKPTLVLDLVSLSGQVAATAGRMEA